VWQARAVISIPRLGVHVSTEALRKNREVLAFGLLAVPIIVFIVGISLLFKNTDSSIGGGPSFSDKAAVYGHIFLYPVIPIALVLAVALVTGMGERTRNARSVVLAALGIGALCALLGLICILAALGADVGGGTGALPGSGKITGLFFTLALLLFLLIGLAYAAATFQTMPSTRTAGAAQQPWAQQGWPAGQPGQGWSQQGGAYQQVPGQQAAPQGWGQQQDWGQQGQQDWGQQGWGQPQQSGWETGAGWGQQPGPAQQGAQQTGDAGVPEQTATGSWGQPSGAEAGQWQSGGDAQAQPAQGQPTQTQPAQVQPTQAQPAQSWGEPVGGVGEHDQQPPLSESERAGADAGGPVGQETEGGQEPGDGQEASGQDSTRWWQQPRP
jgi:hypothetical protein